MIEGIIKDIAGEKKNKSRKKVMEKKKFKCRYCGLDFDSQKFLNLHVDAECVGKLIHQRTSIIGKLEKYIEKIKLNGGKEVYNIKEGIKVLQKMENIRKGGKVPVIKIMNIRHVKELKKVIDFRDEIIYAKNNQRDFLNFLIGLKPKLIIGNFSKTDEKIFGMNKINSVSEKEMKVKITNTCGEINPKDMSKIFSSGEIKKIKKGSELKLILDLSLVDESEGKKNILQTGKFAVPLIEKKLEEMEKSMNSNQPEVNIEEKLESFERGMDQSAENEEKKESSEKKIEESKEIKKESNLAKELNLINLKNDYLKIEESGKEKEKKPGLFSSITKKREVKEKKKTLKEAAFENLSKSKELEDYDKASVIVAHVLKQFLEIKMQCQKELTYMELTEKLKTFHLPVDYIDQIIQFYNDMHIQEYKDEVKVNFQEAHDLAERVINDLA